LAANELASGVLKSTRETKTMIHSRSRSIGAFTLTEVVFSLALIGLMAGGIINGYIQSARVTDWQAHSLAAQSLAMQRVEQCRAAKWDTRSFPVVDQLVASNFPAVTERMDLPTVSTNASYATIYTTITTVSASPPLRMMQADCVWRFPGRGWFTNTIVTYRAPDQ
jgi:type II secretory pathway pseudopilin PulG